MVDTVRLKDAVRASGVTYRHIASKLGISQNCLIRKISNQNEFKASEIKTFSEIIRLSHSEMYDIFFGDDAECIQQTEELK